MNPPTSYLELLSTFKNVRACAVNYSHNVSILVISLGNFGISKEKFKKTIVYLIKTTHNNTNRFVSEAQKRSKCYYETTLDSKTTHSGLLSHSIINLPVYGSILFLISSREGFPGSACCSNVHWAADGIQLWSWLLNHTLQRFSRNLWDRLFVILVF